ncbi:MAG: response regulator [Myxococcales bacterium]|nr:response regulator [Myxococcales bacterium]
MTDWFEQQAPIKAAHERFLQALPGKAQELHDFLPGLLGAPAESQLMEEMRRRLHALYASAQVFQSEVLADTVKTGIDRLEMAREQHRRISQADIEALRSMLTTVTNAPTTRGAPGRGGLPARAGYGGAPNTVVGVPGHRTSGNGLAKPPPPPQALRHVPARRPPASVLGVTPPKRASGSFTAVPVIEEKANARAPSTHDTPLQHVLSVLVVGEPDIHNQMRSALPGEGFEVLGTTNAEEALRLARSIAPDVMVVSEGIVSGDHDLVGRLRADPLTDFVPVIVLVDRNGGAAVADLRAKGIDVVLPRQAQAAALLKAIREVTDTAGEDGGARLDVIGKASALDVFRRMTQEMERGLIESLERGQDLRVELGDGSDILAATWSAISRVRAELSKASRGQIRFKDIPRRGGPAMMALTEDVAEDIEGEHGFDATSLQGRRVLVVDDDPSVRWFFAGLMREEGATVDEAAQGLEALLVARIHRPDIVISDILMPEMDGFALCRELKRDPGLSDVPVILLSWKDDFLQRMRELNAGASGYLRKEARSSQILERVREVLRPRARLEERLRVGGEVRGRLEGIGIIPLLRTLAVERPDARFILRDAWNLFEVDIRRGCLADLTRTAIDGSFTRGEAALPQLLGATSGRFTISEATQPVRSVFHEPLEDSLRRGTRWLGALMDAVSGTGLMHAEGLTFNDEVISAFMRTSPEPVRELVQKLVEGHGPRALILGGEVAPQALESVMVDLARRGGLRSVHGPAGEDRVAVALRERESAAPSDGDIAGLNKDSLAGIDQPGHLASQPHWLTESMSREEHRVRSSHNLPGPFDEDMEADLRHLAEHTQKHISSYPPPAARSGIGEVMSSVSPEAMSTRVASHDRVMHRDLPGMGQEIQITQEAPARPTVPEVEFPQEFVSSFDSSLIGMSERPPAENKVAAEDGNGARARGQEKPAAKDADVTQPERPSARRKSHTAASWLWNMSLVLLVCVGFLGWLVWQEQGPLKGIAGPRHRNAAASGAGRTLTPLPTDSKVQDPAQNEAPRRGATPTTLYDFGVRLAGIASVEGVTVGPHQGLLVISTAANAPIHRVEIDGRPVQFSDGKTREELALAAGQHELAVGVDGETHYRFFAIHEGETRNIDVATAMSYATIHP